MTQPVQTLLHADLTAVDLAKVRQAFADRPVDESIEITRQHRRRASANADCSAVPHKPDSSGELKDEIVSAP